MRQERTIHLRSSIPENTPLPSLLCDGIQIKLRSDHTLRLSVSLSHQSAGLIRNKGRTIKRHLRILLHLMADPVGSNYRHDICSRMPLHTSLPVRFGIRLKNRLTADSSGVKQDLRAQKRHASGSFREPLIPADSHTSFSAFASVASLSHVQLICVAATTTFRINFQVPSVL